MYQRFTNCDTWKTPLSISVGISVGISVRTKGFDATKATTHHVITWRYVMAVVYRVWTTVLYSEVYRTQGVRARNARAERKRTGWEISNSGRGLTMKELLKTVENRHRWKTVVQDAVNRRSNRGRLRTEHSPSDNVILLESNRLRYLISWVATSEDVPIYL